MRSVDSELPLKAVDFHILLTLTDGPLHGYGIVKGIEERSADGIRLEPGNLYRYVRRLVEAGMVEAAGRRPTREGSSERRRDYRITPFGRRVLAAEAERMRALLAMAASRVPLRGGSA